MTLIDGATKSQNGQIGNQEVLGLTYGGFTHYTVIQHKGAERKWEDARLEKQSAETQTGLKRS